ncbi:MAG: glutamate--tRNA ligase [Proteobacteria bacterium]|nr:glutamate--tRNA ligase [Pseudomonadota bacterium]
MVRTRFAPSPTGYLHIGGARTALFNWLYARNQGGKFILRIEDTDVERSTEESVQAILDGMKWLNLDWDEGPFFQSKRMDRYTYFAEKLLKEGKAYYCYCKPEELQERREQALKEGKKPTYDRRCRDLKGPINDRKPVIRFKAPLEGETIVDDIVKGRVIFKNEELDDLIIIRSDGFPTYNFAVVIDDVDMNITHVIRGDDHLNNTPRQIQIYKALDFPIPVFAHVPMILGSDKTRLSKRHGATSVMAYKEMGYISDALVNYLVRLGWSYGDQEIFTREEMIEKFNLENIGKSPAVFNPEKLLWLNAHYIREMDPKDLSDLAREFFEKMGYVVPEESKFQKMLCSLRQRGRTLVEIVEMADFYFTSDFQYEEQGVKKLFNTDSLRALKVIREKLSNSKELSESEFEVIVRKTAEDLNIKVSLVAQSLRLAITGKTVSPGLYEIIEVIGVEETIRRIQKAIDYMEKT